MAERALVVGFGVSGQAAARNLRARGWDVVVVDDVPSAAVRERAAAEGFDLDARPLPELVAEADVVVPTPGLPESHPVIAVAAELGRPVRSEIEVASGWTSAPLVAITGTNGKTTVTELVAAMLKASGRRAVACGNIGLTFSDAATAGEADVFVVEVSSFQLRFTDSFRPAVAVWLNLAQDHLDWHPDLDSYAAAKARVWAYQGADDVTVVNADDPVVMTWAASAPSRVVTFGLDEPADWSVGDGWLRGPAGPLVAVADLPRTLPHELANDLAAAAAALAAGATVEGVVQALRSFTGLPHRMVLVAEAGGVRWYDDSKATNPHATLAALRQFDSAVLIAGGRNKGLDLSALVVAAPRVRAVVALGEAANEVVAAFDGLRPVVVAGSMDEAVKAAAEAAEPGDAVLLSPACTSWDMYRDYAERGDDFARAVRERVAG